jgi:hypothetical protein
MKVILRTLLILAPALACTLHAGLLADDKKAKEPEKKKAEPAKPVVVEDQWINADLKDKQYINSYFKTYTFKMEKDKSYQIDLASANAYRVVLRLENSAGNQVASDFDQSGRNQPATIIHRSSKTEDYQIIATCLNQNNLNGKFTLTVKELTGDEGKPIELKIDKGVGEYRGNLGRTDPRYNGKIHKLFLVKLEQGKTYQIDHISGAFDAYLYLQSPEGNVLAQDDDGGVGLNSRIVYQAAKTGEYRIVATSLGGQGVGQFSFQVTEKK